MQSGKFKFKFQVQREVGLWVLGSKFCISGFRVRAKGQRGVEIQFTINNDQ